MKYCYSAITGLIDPLSSRRSRSFNTVRGHGHFAQPLSLFIQIHATTTYHPIKKSPDLSPVLSTARLPYCSSAHRSLYIDFRAVPLFFQVSTHFQFILKWTINVRIEQSIWLHTDRSSPYCSRLVLCKAQLSYTSQFHVWPYCILITLSVLLRLPHDIVASSAN